MSTEIQDLILRTLRLEKETFWLEHKDLPPTETQRLWTLRTTDLASFLAPIAPAEPLDPEASVPRSLGRNAFHMQEAADLDKGPDAQIVPPTLIRYPNVSQSSVAMSRKRSNDSRPGQTSFNYGTGKDLSPLTIAEWQANVEEPFSNYSLAGPSKMQRTASGRKSLQPLPEIEVYNDPKDHINKAIPIGRQGFAASRAQRPRRNSHRISNSPGMISSLGNRFLLSQSPITPTSGTLTNATTLTTGMSRQSSCASNSICGGFEMMAIRSQHSDMSDFSTGEAQSPIATKPSLASTNDSIMNVFEYDRSHVLDHTGGIAHDSNLSTFPVLPVPSAPSLRPSVVEEDLSMKRSSSAESNASSQTRASRRRQEQLAQSERPIAPKLSEDELAMSRQSSTSEHRMIRVESADGSSKDLMAITKAPYNRPHREKVKCDKCNDHPDGFRGEHELRRHMDRAHSTSRRIWRCVDRSADKSKLANCKACRQGKTYNAYYNAAAHLRRVHFNPKSVGRKTKGDSEKGRGGIGGGTDPPMEEIKKWMLESVEPVDDNELVEMCESTMHKRPNESSGDRSLHQDRQELTECSRSETPCASNQNREPIGVSDSSKISSTPLNQHSTLAASTNSAQQRFDHTLSNANPDFSEFFFDSSMSFDFELPFDDSHTFSGFDDSLPLFEDM